jgi:hypothetical protein
VNTAQPPAQQAQQEHAPGAERDPANSGFDGYGTDKINDPGLPRAPWQKHREPDYEAEAG